MSTHDDEGGERRAPSPEPPTTGETPPATRGRFGVRLGGPSVRRFGLLARAAGIYLLFALTIAVLAELLLEVSRTGGDWTYVGVLLGERAGVVAAAVLVGLLLVGGLLAITARMWLTGGLVLIATALIGVASHAKDLERREPIYPQDLSFLREPGFLLQMADPRLLWWTLAGLVVLAATSWGLDRLFSRWLRRRPVTTDDRAGRVTAVASRLTVVAVATGLLLPLLSFNQVGNPWRDTFEASGADWRKASRPFNYDVNGFVAGFLYNLNTPAMARPPGYSRAAMQRIVHRYTAEAEEVNQDRTPGALDDVNVVSVLEESMTDPTRLSGLRLSEDPLTQTRALMAGLPHGTMLSPKTGGGTSSMEFEVLTGMSLSQFHPTMDTPYQQLVPHYRSFPSAVEMFRQMGHTPVAVHPFNPGLYERDRVYPILGFADFIDRSRMEHRAKLEENPFISDGAAFRQVLDELDGHEEPVFLNLVTMQNHTPYDGKYADPVEVTGLSPEGAEMLGQYSRGLSYTDEAISHFVRALGRSQEKTVLVVYGDHVPAGIPGEVFDENDDRTLHETPFFLYANFGDAEPVTLPTTSPIFFMPHLFDLADAPVSPYYAMLEKLEQHVTAMEHGWMIGPDGEEVRTDTLTEEGRRVLHDYRMVQYDLAIGQRYSEEMLYPSPAGTLEASGPPD